MMVFLSDSLALSEGTNALLIRLTARAAKTGKRRFIVVSPLCSISFLLGGPIWAAVYSTAVVISFFGV
jgi:hypothetical protein